jgi:hypothetical protein
MTAAASRFGLMLTLLTTLAAVVAAAQDSTKGGMDDIAERYVKLVLGVGQIDADYVDAYFGPPEWRPAPGAPLPDIARLRTEAAALSARLAAVSATDGDELSALRHEYLTRQLSAVDARLRMLQGERLSFDEESRALYDAVAPTQPASVFEGVLEEIARRLPGEGPLVTRYDTYRRAFVVPTDRLDAVFRAAIDACRERTRGYVELPPAERFTLEFVTGKPWSGYNWYQGGAVSLIQINTDLPIHIDRAIDLACHEGYPGHHVYNVLLEEQFVRRRGWVEFTVYPLFSPQSLIAEGTANFGIEAAFPGDARAAFERQRLFPLAGLDERAAGPYYELLALVDRLDYAGNEAARGYLDGRMTRADAVAWLERYALMSTDRAEQRVRFMERYRSYVINYNFGKDLVREYIEARGGTADQPGRRWAEFTRLISSPRLPSGLRAQTP